MSTVSSNHLYWVTSCLLFSRLNSNFYCIEQSGALSKPRKGVKFCEVTNKQEEMILVGLFVIDYQVITNDIINFNEYPNKSFDYIFVFWQGALKR